MGLREVATRDLNKFLDIDFSYPISLIDPNGITANIAGYTNDIAQVIDANTGEIISGRLASIAISINDIYDAGMNLPTNIQDSDSKPWRVIFEDLNGNTYNFKVTASNPDRALGIITCELEQYDPNIN